MMNYQHKSETLTKGSYFLGIVWTGSLVAGTIFISVTKPFSFWWVLILISIVSIILLVLHIMFTKNSTNQIEVQRNISKLYWLFILQLITLNIPLFAYEIIGLIWYNKANALG